MMAFMVTIFIILELRMLLEMYEMNKRLMRIFVLCVLCVFVFVEWCGGVGGERCVNEGVEGGWSNF